MKIKQTTHMRDVEASVWLLLLVAQKKLSFIVLLLRLPTARSYPC